MEKVVKVLIFAFLTMVALSSTLKAEDMNAVMDKFYNGLAETIERNMDNPDNCVREVDSYYEANRATVEKMRKRAEEYQPQAMAMLNKYKTMGDEAPEMKFEQKDMTKSWASPGVIRCSKAFNAFAMKYPQSASRISSEAMQFVPGTR